MFKRCYSPLARICPRPVALPFPLCTYRLADQHDTHHDLPIGFTSRRKTCVKLLPCACSLHPLLLQALALALDLPASSPLHGRFYEVAHLAANPSNLVVLKALRCGTQAWVSSGLAADCCLAVGVLVCEYDCAHLPCVLPGMLLVRRGAGRY